MSIIFWNTEIRHEYLVQDRYCQQIKNIGIFKIHIKKLIDGYKIIS